MRVSYVLLAALLIGTGFGQQAAEPPSAGSGVVFQSSSREVLLELVVRDAHGKLVTKIDPGQVSVYEDGVRQEVKSFRLVPGHEVRVEVEKEMEQAAKTHSAAPGAARPMPANPLRTVNLVCLILNDLNPQTRKFAFDAASKFVNKEVRPDTFIGVFSLDASGLRPVFPFSNNREHLLKAVELAAVNQLPTISESTAAVLSGLSMSTLGVPIAAASSIAANGAAIVDAPAAGVPTGADGSSVQDPLGTRGDMAVAANAGLREIDALIAMVKQLAPFPFQKTVLFMGTGLTRPPDQLEYWQSLLQLANKGGVTFYSVDVYGLAVCQDQPDCADGARGAQGASARTAGAVSSTASSASVALLQQSANLSMQQVHRGTPNAAQAMEMMHQSDYLRFGVSSANTQEALREIAESTGGFLIANTNNIDGLLTRVMDDVDTHYELSYRPASPGADGRFRKIEVKLARPDLRVQTRSGYYAVPEMGEGPLTAGDFGALEALDAKPRPRAFEFQSRAFRFRPGSASSQYAIAFEVPVASLTATAETGEKKHRFHAYLMALVKNAQGEIVERVSKDVMSEVADEHLAALHPEAVVFEHAINLGPGRFTIESAVVDQEGNRASTASQQIDNPEQAGPGLSDIALLRRVQPLDRAPDAADPFEIPGKRALPFVSTELGAGARPSIYFVVYPERGADKASVEMRLLKDGRVLATQKAAVPAPDAGGAVPMTIQPVAGPGDYEVKITVEQGHRSAERTLQYTIASK